ncbi:MAG: hypothetical protein QXE64_01035 [Candidatus Pacearchaeota archaeon]
MKKCVYCDAQINDERAIDVCDECGNKVWGEVMFRTIVNNMEKAKKRGDLWQGLISVNEEKEKKER